MDASATQSTPDAIGVFDSGLGGLTVVKELQRLLPHENIVYFGDTARVPYGTRSNDTIRSFALQDTRFLMDFSIKMLVIACGTASSIALNEVKEICPVPVIGAVVPAAQAAIRATRNGKIAIFGTNATIRSQAIEYKILEIFPDARVFGQACPLLVPLIENGYVQPGNQILNLAIAEYLAPVLEFGADTLILGCTHYPIIKQAIQQQASSLTLIDSGEEIAAAVTASLTAINALAPETHRGSTRFYVSDNGESFAQMGSLFLGKQLRAQLRKANIEDY